MGFHRKKRARISFVDGEFAGLEVVARVGSIGEWLDVRSQEERRSHLEVFAGFIESWNVTDENDNPVPATYDGMLTQDKDLMDFIIHNWMRAVNSVPEGKEQASTSGDASREASIPMEALSESPSN